jgi:hypothetical protein
MQDADAFPADELTDREIDELYVREMERRERERERRDSEAAAAVVVADVAQTSAPTESVSDSQRVTRVGPTIAPGHFASYPTELVIALIAAAADDHPALAESGYIVTQLQKATYLREAAQELLRRAADFGRVA